jgi:hypothetical protein
MKDGCLNLSVVVFGEDHLLLGVGTADRGTIAVPACPDLPGADAVNPGDAMGMFSVGRALDLTFVRAGGA